MRLLLTRPEPDAERTAAALRARGHAVIITPLLHIEAVDNAEIDQGPWDALLVTSANAAHAIERHARLPELRAVPVLVGGERSAEAMRAVGFADVTSAGGNVDDLVRLVGERVKPGARLLYLAAGERAGDLAGTLRRRGYSVRTAVVYRAVVSGSPRAVADALARGIDGVLHFSRRSAEAYINAARDAGVLPSALRPGHYCLSAQVAEPLADAGASTRVALQPTEAALIALIPDGMSG